MLLPHICLFAEGWGRLSTVPLSCWYLLPICQWTNHNIIHNPSYPQGLSNRCKKTMFWFPESLKSFIPLLRREPWVISWIKIWHGYSSVFVTFSIHCLGIVMIVRLFFKAWSSIFSSFQANLDAFVSYANELPFQSHTSFRRGIYIRDYASFPFSQRAPSSLQVLTLVLSSAFVEASIKI